MNLITDIILLILIANFIDKLVGFDPDKLNTLFKLDLKFNLKSKELVKSNTLDKKSNSLEALTSMDWRYKGVN